MSTQKKGRIAFAVCGSFCTLEAALAAAQQLTEQGWELLPIMSFAAKQDTRFGTGQFWQERLEALTSHAVLDTLQAVEPLGPKKLVSALVIAPCTGATLARLAAAAKQRLNGFSAGVKCGILLSDALPVQYDGQKNAQWRKTR